MRPPATLPAAGDHRLPSAVRGTPFANGAGAFGGTTDEGVLGDSRPAAERIELVESVVVHASVTSAELSPAAARAVAQSETAGAVVVFEGVIRSHDGEHVDVTGLEYTAHPTAGDVLTVVAGEIAAENPGVRVFVQHRVGSLEVGDVALLAVVASAHRAEAFFTCGLLVDRVKERVPIWKQQHFSSGSHEWVGL